MINRFYPIVQITEVIFVKLSPSWEVNLFYLFFFFNIFVSYCFSWIFFLLSWNIWFYLSKQDLRIYVFLFVCFLGSFNELESSCFVSHYFTMNLTTPESPSCLHIALIVLLFSASQIIKSMPKFCLSFINRRIFIEYFLIPNV